MQRSAQSEATIPAYICMFIMQLPPIAWTNIHDIWYERDLYLDRTMKVYVQYFACVYARSVVKVEILDHLVKTFNFLRATLVTRSTVHRTTSTCT